MFNYFFACFSFFNLSFFSLPPLSLQTPPPPPPPFHQTKRRRNNKIRRNNKKKKQKKNKKQKKRITRRRNKKRIQTKKKKKQKGGSRAGERLQTKKEEETKKKRGLSGRRATRPRAPRPAGGGASPRAMPSSDPIRQLLDKKADDELKVCASAVAVRFVLSTFAKVVASSVCKSRC